MFRDEIENLLYNISDFEKGARNKTINSRGRARILDANSRETFRDREFSPMSELRKVEKIKPFSHSRASKKIKKKDTKQAFSPSCRNCS